MRRPTLCTLALAAALSTRLAGQDPYRLPPKVIVDILDAPPFPFAILIPDRTAVLLTQQASMPTIAELAEPMLRLAGLRINPRTNGPHLAGRVTSLVIKRVADGSEQPIALPPNPAIGPASWSPDGKKIAFTSWKSGVPRIYELDLATGRERMLPEVRGAGDYNTPVYSPDGTTLAFSVLGSDYRSGIFTYNVERDCCLAYLSGGPWYDFSVTVQGQRNYSRRFAGRMEAGVDSFCDPAMQGIAVAEQYRLR